MPLERLGVIGVPGRWAAVRAVGCPVVSTSVNRCADGVNVVMPSDPPRIATTTPRNPP